MLIVIFLLDFKCLVNAGTVLIAGFVSRVWVDS